MVGSHWSSVFPAIPWNEVIVSTQSPADSLSDGQKACLRLVGRGHSSKEIAIATKLSPQTVDTYIKVAIARLGAQNRRDAARILADWEHSQKSGPLTAAVADDSSVPDDGGAVGRTGVIDLIIPPPIGGSVHEMDAAAKTVAALKVALLGGSAVIALALLMAGIMHTFR